MSQSTTQPTRRRVYVVPQADEDDFTADLWDHGAIGCRIDDAAAGRLRVDAWFAEPSPPELAGFDADLASRWPQARLVEDAVEEPKDWLAEYRARSVPFELGARFVVDPGEPDDAAPAAAAGAAGRTWLRIPARTAFGTGSHESTRLCVFWLEELAARGELAARRILDVGTGSGILAFCAERLGARDIVGFDFDAPSVLMARDYARTNGCAPWLLASTIDALVRTRQFDLALVNVLPERILDGYGEIVARLRPGALVVSSGNLTTRRDEMLARFADFGLALDGEKSDGEWSAFLLRLEEFGS